MLVDRSKLIATVSLGILLCIFGCIGIARLVQKGSEGNLPIRRLQIIIEVRHREELFEQLQKFADKHSFRLLIRDVAVIPEGIFIEMYRDDLQILAGSTASDPTTIDLGIYESDVARPITDETIDELFKDLKSFINEIPNITIVKEK